MQSNIINANSDEIKDILSAIEEATTNLELGMEALSSSANQDRYLNNNQVCEMLHISQRTLQDYRDKGRISFYKLEGKILYKYSDIGNMLNSNYYRAWEWQLSSR